MARYIEFLGVPGSGKTTIASALIAAMSAQGRECRDFSVVVRRARRNVVSKLALYLLAIARHPMVAFDAIRVWLSNRHPGRPGLTAPLYVAQLRYLLGRHAAGMPGDSWLIADQGMLQAVGSLLMPGTGVYTESLVSRLCRRFEGVIDRVVLVECGQVECLTRIRARRGGTSRLDSWGDAEAREGIATQAEVLGFIGTAAPSGCLLRVDGGALSADTATNIMAVIE